MSDWLERTELLFGNENIEKLKNSRVAIFGIGGVGSFTAEALARSGIGTLDLIDNDTVSQSNLNRQLIALHSTLGKYKVEVMRDRILDINPNAKINIYKTFFMPECSGDFDFSNYDYVVDAIDTVTGKLELVMKCDEFEIPIISSMGAGNKVSPQMFEVSDIFKTSVCPLAKAMRTELKKRGIKKLKVIYSKEEPIKIKSSIDENSRKRAPSSNAFTPSVAGLIIAGEVVKDLIQY
ncbi:MAG: tRNA threonylcarbamoyladenosine dehydratase [Oscillospiraceae bacterium]